MATIEDILAAKARNQAFVREQRRTLIEARRTPKQKGIAHITLKLSEMDERPSDEVIQAEAEAAEKRLRAELTDKGGFVTRVVSLKQLNGDVVVRAWFEVEAKVDA